jgi:hypothetical protein
MNKTVNPKEIGMVDIDNWLHESTGYKQCLSQARSWNPCQGNAVYISISIKKHCFILIDLKHLLMNNQSLDQVQAIGPVQGNKFKLQLQFLETIQYCY